MRTSSSPAQGAVRSSLHVCPPYTRETAKRRPDSRPGPLYSAGKQACWQHGQVAFFTCFIVFLPHSISWLRSLPRVICSDASAAQEAVLGEQARMHLHEFVCISMSSFEHQLKRFLNCRLGMIIASLPCSSLPSLKEDLQGIKTRVPSDVRI